MKPVLSVIAIALALAISCCTPINRSSRTYSDQATIILVECTNQQSIHTNVESLLRQERVSVINFRNLGTTKEIEAKYDLIDPAEAERIKEMLTHIAGVISVEIKKNGLPVRNQRL